MRKRFRINQLLLLLAVISTVGFACKKDKKPVETVVDSKELSLFNHSSGSAVNAGYAKIEHLESGNARITIQLNEAFRQPQVNFSGLITTLADDNEVVFAQLGAVPGGSGNLVVNPVIKLGSALPVKYSELVGTSGYFIKVMSGANVQAIGEIK